MRAFATLEPEAHEANERLRWLYKLVENGVADMDDILKDRITALKADRDASRAALDRAKSGTRPAVDISPLVIEGFGWIMRDKLTRGEIPFRKGYLCAIIDRIEVDDREIRIVGRKDVLEQAVLANGGFVPGVRKWRAGQASVADPAFDLQAFSRIGAGGSLGDRYADAGLCIAPATALPPAWPRSGCALPVLALRCVTIKILPTTSAGPWDDSWDVSSSFS